MISTIALSCPADSAAHSCTHCCVLRVQAPECDMGDHEKDASAHLTTVLDYLAKHHTEHVTAADKQQVSNAVIQLF